MNVMLNNWMAKLEDLVELCFELFSIAISVFDA